jgi:hypothetical protein
MGLKATVTPETGGGRSPVSAGKVCIKANHEHNLNAGPGDFAENILIDGLNLDSLKVGDQLIISEKAVLEITQIGKEDHPVS